MNIKFEPCAWIGLDDTGEHQIRIRAWSGWTEFEATIECYSDGFSESVRNGGSPYFPTLEAAQAAAVKHLNERKSG